mgnify:CR=1 FL=1
MVSPELRSRARDGSGSRASSSAKKIPAETREVMGRATQQLRDSGIMDRIPKVGDTLPAFSMPDTEGAPFGSQEALARGPLVLSVYRGVW